MPDCVVPSRGGSRHGSGSISSYCSAVGTSDLMVL